MDLDLPQERLPALRERFGFSGLSVFGSVARGDDRPDSDLDLRHLRAEGASFGLVEIMALKEELEGLFGPVSTHHLNETVRDQVLRDA
ncbi:nucleotidyltransferase family protein [Planomonospora parontospora]|uniref:nucleotidyltransferase family protein n=1 Tax=Planomonospora parontospora TaxID=58119 RepID=UPI00166F6EA0|nr:nucleotidyltransferase domain-containing protein [Planomonospora parontospora]GGL46107.1 nucleotidyltransferase [Planomonospora parontospora subsp. antibiotica]GII16211.1 nucleotidyltransferase [Planomonospora parontospora subsp. antibiotica]